MKILQIIGIVLIVAAVALGAFSNIGEAWMLAVVAGSAGLVMTIIPEVKAAPAGKGWIPALVAGGLSAGTTFAIIGGVTEATLTTIIGLVIAAVSIILGIAMRAKE
jgi:hypothetical protein